MVCGKWENDGWCNVLYVWIFIQLCLISFFSLKVYTKRNITQHFFCSTSSRNVFFFLFVVVIFLCHVVTCFFVAIFFVSRRRVSFFCTTTFFFVVVFGGLSNCLYIYRVKDLKYDKQTIVRRVGT